jgi:hypothetical protein
MFGAAAAWGAAIWLVLTIPVLAAGLVRLGRPRPRDEIRSAGWICTWIAGVALMWVVALWGQLPLCAAFLALGVIVTWVLARPTLPQG